MTQAIAQRTTAAPPRVAAGARSRRRGFQRRIVVGVAALIAATLLLPLVLIVIDAHNAGWTEFRTVLFRERSLILLRHTVVLAALVAALAGVLGVATAWCTDPYSFRTFARAGGSRPGHMLLIVAPRQRTRQRGHRRSRRR